MATGKIIKHSLVVQGLTADAEVLKISGTLGTLFSITDDYSGVLHSIADISGVPVFKVEDDGVSTFTGPVFGVAPTSDLHLATKKYVDDNAGGGGSGTVTSVGTNAPLTGTITTSGTLSITQATTSTDGYLSSTDWNTFNNKTSNTGTVTSVSGGTGLSSTGGTTPTLSLDNTAVVAGTYTNADITVDAQGRLTAAATGSTGGTANNSTITLSAGTGLSTGGDFTTNQASNETITFNFDGNSLPASATLVGTDDIVVVNGTASQKEQIDQIPLSIFNNDAGWTSNSGDITNVGVTAPITGGGASGSVNIGISQATTSTNGYLSSTDWNTFNNKTSNAGTVTNVTVGTGLDITNGTTTPNITVDLSEFSAVDGSGIVNTTDYVMILDGTVERKILMSNFKTSWLNNDAGWTTNTGDITGITVTAGNGLTGGGTDNSGAVSLTLNVGAGSGISVAADTVSLGALTGNWDAGGYEIRSRTFESDVATGTAPFTVASTTAVTNLNADYLDGQHGSAYLRSNTGDDMTGGYLRMRDNIELYFGTATSQSYIVSDATNTNWHLTSGNLYFKDATTTRFTFERTTGYFTCTASYATSSRELKENISPYEDSALEVINAMEVVNYDFKDKSSLDNIGAIAEDVPDEIATEDRKAIDIYSLTFILSKAVQELDEENTSLKDKLEDMEHRYADIIKRLNKAGI